jgi:hypothetical protein
MNKTRITVSLAVLAFLLSACEEETGLGEKVNVTFSVNNVGYDASGEGVRSAAAMEPESTVIPLGSDLYLYATLIPDADAGGLRAALSASQKVRFEAFNTDGTVAAPAVDYYYSEGQGRLVAEDEEHPLEVAAGGSYRFVAYSYAHDPTAYPTPIADIDPSGIDLVCGKANKTISAGDNTVVIDMKHVFPRINLKIKADAALSSAINDIETVQIEGSNKSTLDLFEAKAIVSTVSSPELSLTVGGWTGFDSNQITSGYYMVFQTVTKLNISKLTVTLAAGKGGGSHDFEDISAIFHKTLTPGTSYTLVLDLKETHFAGSNIYWDVDTQQLTFDLAGDRRHEGYQGVFFRWGSLVGISPAQVGAGSKANNFTNQSIPIYVPAYNSGDPYASTWIATTTTDVKTDAGVAKNYSTWTQAGGGTAPDTDIPFMDGRWGRGYDVDFVSKDDQNTDATYEGLRGDICKYLGKTNLALDGYRLPTCVEFSDKASANWDTQNPTTVAVAGGWVKGYGDFTVDTTLGNAFGTADLLSAADERGSAINVVFNAAFPCSGYRYYTNGVLMDVGNNVCYWSSSRSSNSFYDNGRELYIVESYVDPRSTSERGYGYPIRCIKAN